MSGRMSARCIAGALAVAIGSCPAGAAQAASQAPASAPRGISPDSDPACATPAPPPLTIEQMNAYRTRTPTTGRPQLPAANVAVPIREGAMPKHQCFIARAKRGGIDLLFVGDSITDFFGRADRGRPVWNDRYGKLNAANFGISGDTTQDVLWRMQNGELEGFEAKLIVLMLGTNNIGRNPNAEIAAGNAAIVAEFRKRQPQAKVLVLGIFPRGNSPNGAGRKAVAEINSELAKLADGKSVFYLDIGPKFLSEDGTMADAVMVDGLHPGIFGYAVWADAIAPIVAQLMQ